MRKPFRFPASVVLAMGLLIPFQEAKAQGAPQADRGARSRPSYTPADVRFMQGMIAHHAQALAMTALLRDRTSRADMRLMAQRIDVSQTDEIGWMKRWLEARHQGVPDSMRADEHHDANHMMSMPGMSMPAMLMPGMLTPEQMSELAAATGPEFDRLFLRDMIQHHEGALVMVRDLLATNGAAQEPETFQFSADIDAGQRAEIARMRAMLAASPGAKP